jgi:transposase
MPNACPISLSPAEREQLESWARSGTTEKRYSERARIILAVAAGEGTNAAGRRLGVRPATVSKWRLRFARERLDGLKDLPRSGAPPQYGPETEKRILARLDEPVREGQATWTAVLLSRALGDVSVDEVGRVLRRNKIHLHRRRSWCVSTDPEFAPKAADIVGLYLNPPENAVVLCVDEKPSIQALERAQGYLRLHSGQAVAGFGHEYRRHGTTTLFAALDVLSGQVQAAHTKRRRRREFLDFMNEVVANHPGKEVHVVLDNLSTHKPKTDGWLARHKNVHFHFTPTPASWMNMVECWFSILSRRALAGASFTSPQRVRESIDKFIAAYNETAQPFEWHKAEVRPVPLKKRYADLRD